VHKSDNKDYDHHRHRHCLLLQVFSLVLPLHQRCPPPPTLQASHCSTFRIMCDVPSTAVFCSESIECFPHTASRYFLKLFVTNPVSPITTGTTVHFYCLGIASKLVSIVCNMIHYYGEELLLPCPTPNLEGHPFSAVCNCLFNTFAATHHAGGRSTVHSLRKHSACVTGTHLSWFVSHTSFFITHRYLSSICVFV
jgi:hypothetical protein